MFVMDSTVEPWDEGCPQVNQKILNFRDKRGRTALHVAVAYKNIETVEMLLQNGANPLIEDIYGQRPIDLAVEDVLVSMLKFAMSKSEVPTY